MNKVITVSIGVYNGETFLDECLSSLCDSRYVDLIDVIIIDDGSTDTSALIAQKFADRYRESFRLIKKENGGIGSTYNAAVPLAKGHFFMTLDADDKVDADEFYKFIESIKDKKSDLVFFNQRLFYLTKNNNVRFGKRLSYGKNIKCDSDYLFDNVSNSVNIAIHNMAFGTELLTKHGIVADDHYKQYADVCFIMRSLLYVEQVDCYNNDIYLYRIVDGQSISPSGMKKYRESTMAMVASAINIYEENKGKVSIDRKKYLLDYITVHISTAYYVALFSGSSEIDRVDQLIDEDEEIISNLPLIVKVIRKKNTVINSLLSLCYSLYRKYYKLFI